VTQHATSKILLTHWGQGPILKNLHYTRVESKKKNLQGRKPKVPYITGAKNTINP
jgi:hypothetical protein